VLKEDRPQRIGFHLPSWVSPFVGLSQIAADFLRSRYDKNKLKDFMNAHKAEPWIPYEQEREESRILALRDDRPRGNVPGAGVVSCLTAGVDTQDNGFWYEIRAWGWGPELTSWQVRQGFVEKVDYNRDGDPVDGFQVLSRILWEDVYSDQDDKEYVVELVLQDAMGHRTAEVYEYARMNRGRLFATQGSPRQRAPIGYSNQEFYPGTKKPIPGGVQLCQFNVTFWKNKLAGKLEIDRNDPGAWLYHAETDEDWARQMCAEVLTEKGIWEQIGNRPNHAWDCSVLNLVAAEILGIKHWSREGQPKAAAPPPQPDDGWLPGVELPGDEWLS
jgi:phage terminase large subunit GpA-like protein